MADVHKTGLYNRKGFGPVAKFFGFWAGLFGFIAAGGGSTCPCCGAPGGPVAPFAAELLGGVVRHFETAQLQTTR